jgi:hypothetical protein
VQRAGAHDGELQPPTIERVGHRAHEVVGPALGPPPVRDRVALRVAIGVQPAEQHEALGPGAQRRHGGPDGPELVDEHRHVVARLAARAGGEHDCLAPTPGPHRIIDRVQQVAHHRPHPRPGESRLLILLADHRHRLVPSSGF